MVWVLLVVTGLLAVLAVLVGVLTRRVLRLERRLAEPAPASTPEPAAASAAEPLRPAEFVITTVGAPDPRPEPTPVVPSAVFADLVLKESVVQAAAVVQGLRRALAPEARNRIRFHIRQEVKRSRKQRKAELREVRREWAARQRAAMAPDRHTEDTEDTAA